MDIQEIRKQFPILNQTVHGKPLIYFDNAATTQKPNVVIDEITDFYQNINANVHRGVHHLSNLSTERQENARKKIASFINAEKPSEIIFTRGTTESINLVASSFGQEFIKAGNEIIISHMEHHANIVPWQMIAERKNAVIKVIPITDKGELDLQAFKKMISSNVAIVAVSHVSNVLGTVNPIREIIEISHQHDVPVLIDGAQAIAHSKVDVRELDADFYVFSGHKIYAPTGIGILYGKESYLEKMPPYMGGGEMIANVTFEKTTFNELPFKFEAGTPDYVGASALAKAIDFVSTLGMGNISEYEDMLLRYATEKLRDEFDSDMRIVGMSENKSSIISFQIGNIHPFDLGTLLDQTGVAIRTGHHCAEPLLKRYGYTSIARVSFAVYNTKEEIDSFVQIMKRIVPMLKG